MYLTKINCFSEENNPIPIVVIFENEWDGWFAAQINSVQTWATVNDWQNKKKQALLMASQEGKLEQVVIILSNEQEWLTLGVLPFQLPAGHYQFSNLSLDFLKQAYLAWGMGAYRYLRYRKSTKIAAQLVWGSQVDQSETLDLLESIYLVRDLINTPAEDMMPEHLSVITHQLAERFSAEFCEIKGELLKEQYPCVFHVGKASVHSPRVLELRWGNSKHPKVTLVGKGVCFDTGGLNLKPTSGMAMMKKDMGGAAHVLGLAQIIMAQNLPLQLRIIIPTVDNAVSGNAFRPGDILTSRSGTTIEITNTDAEGRLILCDALTAASEEAPDLLIDFATLTGAARVAVGTDIAAFFTGDEKVAQQILEIGQAINDPCWQLPLYQPYKTFLESTIADFVNSPMSAYAGAITAALFLQIFVAATLKWVHFDLMAFNLKTTPSKPEGGEAMALRTIYFLLKNKFCSIN